MLELITCWLGQIGANTVIPEDTFSRYVGNMLDAILSKEFFKFSEKSWIILQVFTTIFERLSLACA